MSAERNKATVQRMFAESFGGNLAVMDEVFAPEYIGYNPPSEGTEPMRGPDSQKVFVTTILTGFPGIQARFDDLIAEGNKVAALDGERYLLRRARKHPADRQGVHPFVQCDLSLQRRRTDRRGMDRTRHSTIPASSGRFPAANRLSAAA